MNCRVCDQTIRKPTPKSHHLERSPVDPDICLGCWIGWLEMEKFILRATGRTFWTLQIEAAMKQFLELVNAESSIPSARPRRKIVAPRKLKTRLVTEIEARIGEHHDR